MSNFVSVIRSVNAVCLTFVLDFDPLLHCSYFIFTPVHFIIASSTFPHQKYGKVSLRQVTQKRGKKQSNKVTFVL